MVFQATKEIREVIRMEQLITIGIIVVFIGIVIIIIGSIIGMQKGETKAGFGGFIGPIPFGFASERGMLYVVIAIALTMFILFILFGYK